MRLAFAVVPPMSKPMARSMPSSAASRPAPMMPATGPDSIIDTGCSCASRTDITPPFERMMLILPVNFSSRRWLSSRPR